MKKSTLSQLLLCMVISSACCADKITDFGTFGSVFVIQEKHIIEVLKAKIQSQEGQQRLKVMDEQIKHIREHKYIVPKAVQGITPSPKHSSFLFDPSIALSKDLTDHNGVRFYKAGDTVNPLDTMTLSKAYVFIDGESLRQIAFAKHLQAQQNTMIVLVKGDPLTLMRDHDMTVFFDQDGAMVDRFQLKHVPCSITQEGNMLRVTEWTEDELEDYASKTTPRPLQGFAP